MLFVRTECLCIIFYHQRPLLSVSGTYTILIPLTNIMTIVRRWVVGLKCCKAYTSDAVMIEDLISHKEHFWCHLAKGGSSFQILV